MKQKQVDKSHYRFSSYLTKRRWASMWHQLDEVLSLEPQSVLEIGPGPGTFKAIAGTFGVTVETLDIDPELNPDYVASADDIPIDSKAYDVVCAFQALEHLPYNTALKVFSEMVRVARRSIVISLPDARSAWPYSLYIPRMGDIRFFFTRPQLVHKKHIFNGEHYWEVNKRGYSLRKIAEDFCSTASVSLCKSFRVDQNPYHHFFIFQVCDGSDTGRRGAPRKTPANVNDCKIP